MTGAGITGLVAVVYGVGFAVLPQLRSDDPGSSGFRRAYTLGGAAVLLVLALVLIVIPWLSGDRA